MRIIVFQFYKFIILTFSGLPEIKIFEIKIEIPVDLRKIGLLDKKILIPNHFWKAIECQRLEKDASRAPFLCKLQNIDAC